VLWEQRGIKRGPEREWGHCSLLCVRSVRVLYPLPSQPCVAFAASPLLPPVPFTARFIDSSAHLAFDIACSASVMPASRLVAKLHSGRPRHVMRWIDVEGRRHADHLFVCACVSLDPDCVTCLVSTARTRKWLAAEPSRCEHSSLAGARRGKIRSPPREQKIDDHGPVSALSSSSSVFSTSSSFPRTPPSSSPSRLPL
jgi:hypothetical protein